MVSGMFWGAVFYQKEKETAFLWETLGSAFAARGPAEGPPGGWAHQ